MKQVRFQASFAAWRPHARALLQAGVAPEEIEWIACRDAPPPPDAATGPSAFVLPEYARDPGVAAPAARAVPRWLLQRLAYAACFRAPDRWALLYRVLWRWERGERDAAASHDPDGAALEYRAIEVLTEDKHIREALRFRQREPERGPPELLGWLESRHDMLLHVAAKLSLVMGQTTWMIATPDSAVFWDGTLLQLAAGEPRLSAEAPPGTTCKNPHENARESAPQNGHESANEAQPPVTDGEAVISEAAVALWLARHASAHAPAAATVHGGPAWTPLRYWKSPAGPEVPAAMPPASPDAPPTAIDPSPILEPDQPPEDRWPPSNRFASPAVCTRCPIWRHSPRAVSGAGPVPAALMLVGEQPDLRSEQEGRPFLGPAGQLLDEALARAGLARESLYLTHALKHAKWDWLHRQRLLRTPVQREIDACRFWLDKELASVAPRVVVALGATALNALTGPRVNLSEYLGRTIAHEGRLIVPTYHPAYALRTAEASLREEIVATLVTALRKAAALAREGGAVP